MRGDGPAVRQGYSAKTGDGKSRVHSRGIKADDRPASPRAGGLVVGWSMPDEICIVRGPVSARMNCRLVLVAVFEFHQGAGNWK